MKKFIQTILLVFLQLVSSSVYAFQAYPVFTSTDTSAVVFENATTTATIILDIDANDGNGGVNDGVIYGLIGADASSFSINTFGEITFIASPDYDTPSDTDMDNKYELTVTATDADGTINQPVVVFVAPQVEDLLGEATQLGSNLFGENAGDQFGSSVSLSADGSILAIAAPNNDANGAFAGRIRVFEWDSNSSDWTQLGSDLDGEEGDRFGESISINVTGNILAIGAPQNDANGEQSGRVQVFYWDENTSSWTQLGSTIFGEVAGDYFGNSVSLSSDGYTLAVGMVGLASGFGNGFQDQPGSVRVFRWNGTSWVQLGTEIVGENDLDQFGFSVSISSDGSIVAIGARNNDGNVAGAGHVRVFEWDSNSSDWTQLGSDLDGEAESDQFGYSVSLSADGSTVVVGAPNALPFFSAGALGKVHIYKWNKATSIWEQKGTTIYGEQLGDLFGASVSSSADGNVVLVGAPSNNGNGTGAGLVRVFNWNGSTWTQLGSDLDGQAEYDQFGHSVSLSAEGSHVLSGSFLNDDNGSNAGQARVYSLLSGTMTTQLELPGTSGENGWHLFTSPWSNPLNDFLEPLWTQGMTGSDAPDYGASNVYTYSESTQQYTALPSLETSVIPGTGYALYAYADDDNNGDSDSWPKTLTGSGNNLTSSVSIAVSNTDLDGSTGLSGEEGWNLMGNPYPYSIVVDSVISALKEVDAEASTSMYIWDKTANDGEGAYLNSVEDSIKYIAPFQAFWVRLLSPEASGTAVIRPTARTASFATFYKTISGSIPAPMLSFTMSHEGFSSKARLRFNEQAQVGIDPYDVFSKAPLSERYVRMYSEVGDQQLSSNYLPLSGQQMQIPFVLSSSELGTYELEWRVQEIPSDWTLNLIDSQGVSHALSTDGGIVFEVTETGEFPVFEVEWIPGTSNEVNPELPQRLELSQNYPNPFNPTTIIQFSLPQAGQAKVMVYNVMGQKVLELGGKRYEAGVHRLRMDARSLASGVYIYQLFVDGAWVQTQKMTLIK